MVGADPAAVVAAPLGWSESLPYRAIAMRIAIGYAIVSAGVFVYGHSWLLVGLHAGVVAVLYWASRAQSRFARLASDLAPLVVVIALAYGEVPAVVAALGVPYHDVLIQGWETALFGSQPAHALAAHFPNVVLSELLHAGYLSFYLVISLPLVMLYARREREGFGETSVVLMITWVVCCAIFVLFPVQGPRFLWSSPTSVPDGPFRRLSMLILATGSARGTAFPSLHMAASVSQMLVGWRWQRRGVSYAMVASTCLIAIGAVYAGYHYATDMVAGALLGIVITRALTVWRGASRPA